MLYIVCILITSVCVYRIQYKSIQYGIKCIYRYRYTHTEYSDSESSFPQPDEAGAIPALI